MSADHKNQPNIVDDEGSSVPVFTEEDGNVTAAVSEEKSVAPVAAASSSSSSSSSSAPPRQIVEVEEDPAMKEQLEEQAAKVRNGKTLSIRTCNKRHLGQNFKITLLMGGFCFSLYFFLDR